MTVKLAKLFGSNGSSNNNNNNNSPGSSNSNNNDVPPPPPLPPPNANMKHKYYDHQPAAIYGNAYDEDDIDYDDNMSLYSSNTASSACMQRGHAYNNSQRPLLGERKPQLLPKKKQPVPAPATLPMEQRTYVSPYAQQQKRDSVKGLHGFNDFDALSQQYNQHLQSPHIGYPYGSPPSPTVQSSDFVFESHQHHHGKAVSTASTGTGTSKSNCSSTSTSPAVAKVAAAPATTTIAATAPHYGAYAHAEQNVYYAAAPHYPPASAGLHASRFEDDFCTRRNMNFAVNQLTPPTPHKDGPFIFGISHEQQQQTVYAAGQQTPHTLINATSNSTTVSASTMQPNALQQTLIDTSANSGKGAKFLLRKRKSKKTAATATTTATATATATTPIVHKDKQQFRSVKCVLVGDGAVGKTNLILSYLENRFNAEHVPTASDIFNADVMVNDSPVHLTLCDTAGQDTLDPLRVLCYPDSDVFLLCFSVVRPETFRGIKTKWAPKFAKTRAALILVGTQADLRGQRNVLNKLQTNGEKPISYADAWDLATTIGAKYIETSSVTQDKVKEVFDTAIWEGLGPTTLPPTPSFWRKLICLA